VERIVIVGAGLAGARTAQALRERGYAGALTLVGAEPHLPYDRPPLSKALLMGDRDDSPLELDWDSLDVELVLGRHAAGVAEGPVVEVEGCPPLGADAVVLATGSVPVRLPGTADLRGVHVLRTVEDARSLRAALAPGAGIAVVGAGWIGAEVATAAARAGCRVTVAEAAPTPLAGALPAVVGARTEPWYGQAGVDLRLGTPVEGVEEGALHLSGGDRVAFDAAVVGVGVRPATDWLAGAPVARDGRGAVLVDAGLHTSLPGVLAVGDCCAFPSARYGVRMHVEHWDNALRAPDVVAANALGGAEVYDPVPYVWSEQFGRMVQYAGHDVAGLRPVWRGDPDGPAWAVCWLDPDERVRAVLAVDRPRDLVQARRLATRGTPVDPALLADPGVAVRATARTRGP